MSLIQFVDESTTYQSKIKVGQTDFGTRISDVSFVFDWYRIVVTVKLPRLSRIVGSHGLIGG